MLIATEIAGDSDDPTALNAVELKDTVSKDPLLAVDKVTVGIIVLKETLLNGEELNAGLFGPNAITNLS